MDYVLELVLYFSFLVHSTLAGAADFYVFLSKSACMTNLNSSTVNIIYN